MSEDRIDAVLTQRAPGDGFYRQEIIDLLDKLDLDETEEVDPIWLDADQAVVFGFIRFKASEEILDFQTGSDTKFGRAVIAMANDAGLENQDGIYCFAGVKTLLQY